MTRDHNTVLAVIGSVRSRCDHVAMLESLKEMTGFNQAYNLIYQMASDRNICNTDGLIIAAALGAQDSGANPKAARLKDHFPSDARKSHQDLSGLIEQVREARGLLIGTPVYFGDRCSQVQSLFEELKKTGPHPLLGKIVGFVSVGAKRNGGQETTNMLGMNDCLRMGANVVGNGPPTSQFGGTAVAGDLGAVLDDNYGLTTSYGTGLKVGQLAGLSSRGQETASDPKVLLLYSATPSKNLRKTIEADFPSGVAIEEVCLDQKSINRCIACSTCPHPKSLGTEFPCIQPDDMREIRQKMLDADGIVLVGLTGDGRGLANYQIFAERTRFIRRHHFEIANTPMAVVHVHAREPEDNFLLRSSNLALRHNGVLVGPGFSGRWLGDRELEGNEELRFYMRHFTRQCLGLRHARLASRGRYKYETIGYK